MNTIASYLLILIPFAGAALAALRWDGRRSQQRPWLLPATAAIHAGLTFWLLFNPPEVGVRMWLGFDAVARATLPAVSLLFLVCSAYGVAYLRARAERPNRIFTALLLLLLGLLSAGLQARHLGLLWIATEALTLATVPMLHFAGTSRAVEATWKYLLVGGTGIALSLLGSFALGYASLHGGGAGDLTFHSLMAQGEGLSRPWVLIAWVLLLVGYGTKMGLAPMHTWKPDAYGEAPGLVGAILAGGVTTVAFTALLRVRAVVDAAGENEIASRTLMVIGLFSMLVAALFLLGTRDFKRMLAYSSVEHMGILVLAASMGAAGAWAALFHVWTNGLTKGALFLSAGNMRRAAGSSALESASGMSAITPRSAAVFVAGLFAVTACPPFGPFFSELRIIGVALSSGHGLAAGLFLAFLLFAFFGMSRVVFAVAYGRPKAGETGQGAGGKSRRVPESSGTVLPAMALLGLSLWLGLATPDVVKNAWTDAVASLTAQPAASGISNLKSEISNSPPAPPSPSEHSKNNDAIRDEHPAPGETPSTPEEKPMDDEQGGAAS